MLFCGLDFIFEEKQIKGAGSYKDSVATRPAIF